jgi:uncharacterized protein (DUF1684 family)
MRKGLSRDGELTVCAGGGLAGVLGSALRSLETPEGAMLSEAQATAVELLRDHVDLWDWRQRIAELYGGIRAEREPERAWRRWRAARDELFRSHAQSPLDERRRRDFGGLPLFDYDPAFRHVVDLAPAPDTEAHALSGGRDGYVQLIPFARTAGLEERLGGELTLYWLGGYGGGVFLPFRDATTGTASFGGGRYLLDGIKGADLGIDPLGRAILDFNFAYNPSCAYSARWICPLAPPENELPLAISAGERMPA